MRQRITSPTLIRSTNNNTNSKIVRKNKKKYKVTSRTGTFIKNAGGTKGRSIYIGI